MTTDIKGLVARLRGHADDQIEDNLAYIKEADCLMSEAASAIAALEAERDEARAVAERHKFDRDRLASENERLRSVLEPFAHIGANLDPEDGWSGADKLTITFDDSRLAEIDLSCFYAARSFLAARSKEPLAPTEKGTDHDA